MRARLLAGVHQPREERGQQGLQEERGQVQRHLAPRDEREGQLPSFVSLFLPSFLPSSAFLSLVLFLLSLSLSLSLRKKARLQAWLQIRRSRSAAPTKTAVTVSDSKESSWASSQADMAELCESA